MDIFRSILILIIGLIVPAFARAEGLCAKNETVVFNCELEKSTSSLCQSPENGGLAYRNGNDGKVNLQVSDGERGKRDVFFLSSVPYSGGGEAHIRFSRFGYTYFLYDRVIKEEGGPVFSAGIVIYKGKVKISSVTCENDASIREGAYQSITKEHYRSID